jgi:hypothetical protein
LLCLFLCLYLDVERHEHSHGQGKKAPSPNGCLFFIVVFDLATGFSATGTNFTVAKSFIVSGFSNLAYYPYESWMQWKATSHCEFPRINVAFAFAFAILCPIELSSLFLSFFDILH